MTKKLNITSIANELSEGSAFFPSKKSVSDSPLPQPLRETPKPTPLPEQAPTAQQPSHQAPERSRARAPVRPTGTANNTPFPSEASKREIKPRHPFDIYQDQLDLLRKLSIRDKMKGEIGSMSAMVRAALDNYLKDKKI
jgi:hypothetical protein